MNETLNDDNLIVKSIQNFVNICDNFASDLSRHRDKLNSILNELNCVNFRYTQKTSLNQCFENVVRVLLKLPLAEDTIIVKTLCLCIQLVSKHALPIESRLFGRVLIYLSAFIQQHRFVGICDALRFMHALIRNQDKNEASLLAENSTELRETIELLLKLIEAPNEMPKTLSCHYDGYSPTEVAASAMFCLEAILVSIDQLPLINASDDLTASITKTLFKLIFSLQPNDMSRSNYCVTIRSALTACRYIGFSNRSWCSEHVSEIIGACVANMHFGVADFAWQKPQVIAASAQSMQFLSSTSATSPHVNKGGKALKARKVRQTPQHKHRKGNKKTNDETMTSPPDADDLLQLDQLNERAQAFTTSDSDASDTETGRSTNIREKEAKLRLAALLLLSIVAKNVEKRILFGYWHCLFPSDDLKPTTVGLLNCALRDTNQRCRISSLQATSLIVHGTKPFLVNAETTDRLPTAFVPFSIMLGNRLRVMYTSLTNALANEKSLPVLTQILKSLAILVQSTTFQKIQQPHGFIRDFVTLIRRLVYHKDPTIKVAALIVMEFLISGNEITEEISQCVGLSKIEVDENRRIHDYGQNEVIVTEENSADSEYEEDELDEARANVSASNAGRKMSWLLQICLENLGVTVFEYHQKSQSSISIQLRHQSLQVILTMAPHFVWIKSHLALVAEALEHTMNDEVPSIQLRCARCADIIAHSISNYLLTSSDVRSTEEFDEDIDIALLYWTRILPTIIELLNKDETDETMKSILCDAVSNIGAHVFERLPNKNFVVCRVVLLALSESENALVCASATRALAILVLFPSLRDDVFSIQNAIEAAIKIIQNESLPVRIKASWALANITDAIVSYSNESEASRISDNLLMQIFEIIEPICNDNDKVRTNAVRILGNVLRLIRHEHIASSQWQSHCLRAIQMLTDQVKLSSQLSMKVKWNACYAIGNFMRNHVVFELDSMAFDWLAAVCQVLCETIVKCPNFKVRINGAVALAIPSKRSFYRDNLTNVWNATLAALYQSNFLTDFNEYNHRDNLMDQLCITISHLITLALAEDLPLLENILMQHLDSTKQNWQRVINRMVPEKAHSLLMANLHLKNLLENETLSGEQKSAVQTMLECFVTATEYE